LEKKVLRFINCFLFPQSGKTLSARRWQAAFDGDGRLDIAKVLRRIQRGVTFFYCIAGLFVCFSVYFWVYNYYGMVTTRSIV
jgi:hypothetical protein